MALDMERQAADLPSMPLPEPLAGPVAFVGSGDSYAAGLAAYYLSGRASCHQPADIIADPLIAQGRTACFVSVSGRTRANILAAQAAHRAGLHTIAVTADPSSALAKACDGVVKLSFCSAGKTSGTISFTASLLACAWLAARIACPIDAKDIYKNAGRNAARIANRIGSRSVVILGDSLFYPAAMYGALKFNEVLGSRAVAYPLEDFFHAPLFGAKRNDRIIAVGNNSKPAALLKKAGLKSFHIDCKGTEIDSLLHAVLSMQHLVLQIAKKQKREECYFMKDKKLRVSSSFIY